MQHLVQFRTSPPENAMVDEGEGGGGTNILKIIRFVFLKRNQCIEYNREEQYQS